MSNGLTPAPGSTQPPLSGKVQAAHLQRLAVVYVRRPTLQQVEHNRESTRRRYALSERAIELGWSPTQVLVIDEDQGRSGAGADGRPGFQRLVGEVGLDHIGIVLGLEISRPARSSRDWYTRRIRVFGEARCVPRARAQGTPTRHSRPYGEEA